MDSLGERNAAQRFAVEKKRVKIVKMLTVIAVITAVIVLAAFLYYSYINKRFNTYEVTNSVARADSNTVKYMQYGGGHILKYSRDGASGLNSKGEVLWNGSFELRNPIAATCDNYVVIADIGGKEAYVFNGSDSGRKIETILPIMQADVANQGVVALMMEDKNSNNFWLYDPYGSGEQLLFEFTTNVQPDGYPVDFSLSDDGHRLVTTYLYINNGVMENRVNFYNFSDIAKSNINRLVGNENFKQELIGKVDFLNNNMICVYGENSFTLFMMKQIPKKQIDTVTFEENIKSTFSNDDYVGFVLEKYEGDVKYRVVLYDMNGNLVLDKSVDYDYDHVFISGEEVVFYTSLKCTILRANGVERFQCAFDKSVSYMMPVNNYDKYILIDDVNIEEIRLRQIKGKESH